VIVVAEDDASLRRALERLLTVAGFEPHSFESAEEVLADEAASHAACVVSDLKLPAASGLDLLDEMRRRGWQAPMIIITAFDVPDVRNEAARHGVASLLGKPFSATTLLDAIDAVTGSASAHMA
jgi:FixJ family two-component response regulator